MTDDEHGARNGDARRFARVEAAFRVRYRSVDDFVVASSHDLSRGGIFIKTQRYLPVNAVVRLYIAIPGAGDVPVICRVAYVRDDAAAQASGKPAGMGLEFLDDPSRYDQLLERGLVPRAEAPAVMCDRRHVRVLVADADAPARERLAGAFAGRGHPVLAAKNGLEALALCLKHRPELVVAEVALPRLDGWQLLRLVRARPSLVNVPILFVTGADSDELRLRGYRLGADDFLVKSLSDDELVARADRVLARATAAQTIVESRSLRGDLQHIGVAALLSLLDAERTSGVVLVVGAAVARIFVRGGRPLRIEIDDEPVRDVRDPRLGALLGWRDGQFELAAGDPACADELDSDVRTLLLEQARLSDERHARPAAPAPAQDAVE